MIRRDEIVHLLRRIEIYLRRSGTSPTRFGREAVRDPCFVAQVRNGREPRAAVRRRVCAYLKDREQLLEEESCSR